MIISDRGLQIIKTYEGCKLAPYKCPAGIWTVGYGHTDPHGYVERLALEKKTITQHQADELLAFDLNRFETEVSRVTNGANANQFSALVAFTFNVGVSALEKSTLLRLHNQKHYLAAAEQFPKWTHAAGVEMPGLVKRRHAERALYMEAVS